jgi:hypothetical protein
MTVRTFLPLSLALFASFAAPGCAADDASPDEEQFAQDRCNDENVVCEAYGRAANAATKPPAYELGDGTRTPTMKVVYEGQSGFGPVDLEFNPRNPREMWILHYGTSHATIVRNPGLSTVEVIERRDPAYTHYMYKPVGLAMGGTSTQWGQLWSTCGDNDNGGDDHMGPTMYSADLRLFGYQNPNTGLGTHLDMLHSTSYCRGIAWAGTKNQYWVFNSDQGALDFYDFKMDHGPGNTDHSDGVIRRFANRQVKGVSGVMSHMSWDAQTKKLYVADTGNKRIISLDPANAQLIAPLPGNEFIAARDYYEGTLKTVVSSSAGLVQPSGLEASGGLVFVTDASTSKIHAFKMSDGSLVRSFSTGLPSGSLAGLNFGPEGKIYFVDRTGNRVYRLDP